MRVIQWKRVFLYLSVLAVPMAAAQQATHEADLLWQRQHEREEQWQRARSSTPDVRLDAPPSAGAKRLPSGESPCFVIHALRLDVRGPERFGWLVDAADVDASGQPDPANGHCLGTQGLIIVQQRLQDALVRRGLATARVLAAPQNLSHGVLTLTVMPGRVRALRFAEGTASRATMTNAMPVQPGELLDVFALEQGLENFRRLPSVEADVQIMPSLDRDAEPGDSDVVVRWMQQRPWRLNLSVDDAGSRTTGRVQSALTFAVDHALPLNDLLYVTFSKAIGDRPPGPRDARARNVYYALPWREWLVAATYGEWHYFQSVAGRNGPIIYSGESQSGDLMVGRSLYRDARRKTSGSLRLWHRTSNNFIDDAELMQQRRNTAGWELALTHREQAGPALIDANLAYRRGTGAFGALPAPEQAYGEGSARMQMLRAEASLSWPFRLASQPLRYSAAFRRQWNFTPLTPQDRFAIGSRYTVRGFDGDSMLSGDRGWLLRQEIGWSLASLHSELYLGVDTARVSGQSTALLAGRELAGVAVGVRGAARSLAWDVFVGRPVSRPEGFRTADVIAGFYLSASY